MRILVSEREWVRARVHGKLRILETLVLGAEGCGVLCDEIYFVVAVAENASLLCPEMRS